MESIGYDGLTRFQRYRKNHPERVRAAAKRWRDTHLEAAKAMVDAYRRTKQGKQKRKAANRRYLYGGPQGLEHYENNLREQKGKCAICSRKLHKACQDHNHLCCGGGRSCGKCLRGILCDSCNRSIGLLGDNIETLKAAIAYLKKWE